MKAKNLYCLIALGAAAAAMPGTVNAQEVVEGESVTQFTCDNTTRHYQSWRDNWFIQLGAGVNQPFVERGYKHGPIVDHKKMTAVYNVGVGHWFSPYLALRFNAIGGALHWNTALASEPGNGWTKARHVNLNAELMWDMCNSIAGVNPDRVVSVIPFVGLGGDYTWHITDSKGNHASATNIVGHDGRLKTSTWTLPVTAGFQLRFRLSKVVDFFAEARASFYGDNWNGDAYGYPVEANVACIGGLNFNINGRSWNTYNECESMAQLANMNNQVNLLRAENMAQAQEIADLQNRPVVTEVIEKDCPQVPLLTTVRFTINSADIMPTEEVNLYNMAQWMKANPNQTITISGFADKDTGTSDYNMELSKMRADVVYKALTEKYGVNPKNLKVKYDGSNVQPYGENDWNRIVIFADK